MNSKSFMDTCIAIPTINEVENLKILIPNLRALFPLSLILIVDDASTDGTQVFLRQEMVHDPRLHAVFRSGRLGIGSAHILAMEYAMNRGFAKLITMDGDLTHSAEDAFRLLNAMENQDLVIGSRYLAQGKVNGWSPFRYFLTHSGHFVTSLFFRSRLDMSSALRVYRVSKIPLSSIRENCSLNYEFFFTSALVLVKHKLRITQIPVTLERRVSGNSKMNLRLMILGIGQLFFYGLRIKKVKLENNHSEK